MPRVSQTLQNYCELVVIVFPVDLLCICKSLFGSLHEIFRTLPVQIRLVHELIMLGQFKQIYMLQFRMSHYNFINVAFSYLQVRTLSYPIFQLCCLYTFLVGSRLSTELYQGSIYQYSPKTTCPYRFIIRLYWALYLVIKLIMPSYPRQSILSPLYGAYISKYAFSSCDFMLVNSISQCQFIAFLPSPQLYFNIQSQHVKFRICSWLFHLTQFLVHFSIYIQLRFCQLDHTWDL